MHAFFKPVTAAEALQQHQQLLAWSAASTAAAAALASHAVALRRGPGRPKKLLNATSVLTAAALAAVENDDEKPAAKRGKYNNWSVQLRLLACLSHRICIGADSVGLFCVSAPGSPHLSFTIFSPPSN